ENETAIASGSTDRDQSREIPAYSARSEEIKKESDKILPKQQLHADTGMLDANEPLPAHGHQIDHSQIEQRRPAEHYEIQARDNPCYIVEVNARENKSERSQ